MTVNLLLSSTVTPSNSMVRNDFPKHATFDNEIKPSKIIPRSTRKVKAEGKKESKKSAFLKQTHLTSKHKQTEDDGPKPKRGRQYLSTCIRVFSKNSGSKRLRCNSTGEYFERGSTSE